MRTKALVYLMMLSFGIVTICTGQTNKTVQDLASFKPSGPLQDQQTYGYYVIRTYRSIDGNGSFEILSKSSRVYAAYGNKFLVGSIYEQDKKSSLVTMGSDITGDGLPNLLVSEWTGGAHCCFLFHIFEIGNQFRHIQTINAVHSGLADFANLDEDPALEFQMVDWTFAYWRTSFAASPAPAVILKYQGQQYEMASDLMGKPSLSFEQFVQLADEIKSSPEWESKQPPVRLWAEMLDLIYTGRMDQAWDLVDASWPKAIDGKEQFVKDLQAKLRQSPFWKDVQELNRGKT